MTASKEFKTIYFKECYKIFRYYLKAKSVLEKYKEMPSFHGIHSDCELIVGKLTQCLKEKLRETSVSENSFTSRGFVLPSIC